MAARKQSFDEIFRSPDPFISNGFRLLLQESAKAGDPKLLRDFYVRLNSELYKAGWIEEVSKSPWAEEMLLALVSSNPQLTVVALRELLAEMKLHYQDPLVQILVEAAGRVPPLLSLVGDLVQEEGRLVLLRVRALEALFTRLSLGRKPMQAGNGVEDTLRTFNEIHEGLKREAIKGVTKGHERLAKDAKAVGRLVSSLARNLSLLPAEQPELEGGRPEEAYRDILELLQSVLEQLPSAPNSPESLRAVLKVLKANAFLPFWHPSACFRETFSAEKRPANKMNGHGEEAALRPLSEIGESHPPKADSPGMESKLILALIIDRALAIVLEIAVAGWRSETGHWLKPKRPEEISLNPSDPPSLESVLLDRGSRPKTRSMSAALLCLLDYALPSVHLSPHAEFFCRLFLRPYRAGGVHYRLRDEGEPSLVDAEEKLEFLFEALDEESEYVRWNASTVCYQCAREHPEWFKPRHYIKLMSLLSDEHYGIRLDMMRTIRTLASFRNQEIFTVIHDISGRLAEKVYRTKDKERARTDLETALGVSLASLLERIDELQGEVLRLEYRREHLLSYLENQALRIGEEIHHEVLNTLCGYLATAIDEGDHDEAERRLADLVAELRRIMNNLYPKDLEAEGFLVTIRKRLEDARAQMRRRNAKFAAEFDCPAEITDQTIERGLRDKSHLVLLYRIVLEALINARKHAQGTFIGVRFRQPRPGLIEISVSDNGRGSGGPFEESFGMDLMQRRAEDIGAEIEYRKTFPMGGTTVVIRLSEESKAQLADRSKASAAN